MYRRSNTSSSALAAQEYTSFPISLRRKVKLRLGTSIYMTDRIGIHVAGDAHQARRRRPRTIPYSADEKSIATVSTLSA